MTNCKGILGTIFGHKFKEYIIEYTPNIIDIECPSSQDIVRAIDANSKKIYAIRCKRCGAKCEN